MFSLEGRRQQQQPQTDWTSFWCHWNLNSHLPNNLQENIANKAINTIIHKQTLHIFLLFSLFIIEYVFFFILSFTMTTFLVQTARPDGIEINLMALFRGNNASALGQWRCLTRAFQAWISCFNLITNIHCMFTIFTSMFRFTTFTGLNNIILKCYSNNRRKKIKKINGCKTKTTNININQEYIRHLNSNGQHRPSSK